MEQSGWQQVEMEGSLGNKYRRPDGREKRFLWVGMFSSKRRLCCKIVCDGEEARRRCIELLRCVGKAVNSHEGW